MLRSSKQLILLLREGLLSLGKKKRDKRKPAGYSGVLSFWGLFVVGVCFARRQSSLKPRPESVRLSGRELSGAPRDARTCSSANPSFQIKHL